MMDEQTTAEWMRKNSLEAPDIEQAAKWARGADDVDALEAELASLQQRVEHLTGALQKQTRYSADLQQLIEAFARGSELPFPELYHHNVLAKVQQRVEALQRQLKRKDGWLTCEACQRLYDPAKEGGSLEDADFCGEHWAEMLIDAAQDKEQG